MASVYDAMAPGFDRRRSLPDGVPEAIRVAVRRAVGDGAILDLGAGSGRIGRPFVAHGDDYTAVDLSFGMLHTFADRQPSVRAVQADGMRLPFADGRFGGVVLVQVLSGVPGWRHLLTEALRVLRSDGALLLGRVVAPDDGIDARMKAQLAAILAAMDTHPYRDKPRDDATAWLARAHPDHTTETVATWTASRSPRAFLERHAGGVRFSVLPEPVKVTALQRLTEWANGWCTDLDAPFAEQYRFELSHYRPQPRTPD